MSGDNLQAAAQILAVEAYHAGNVRLQVIQKSITSPAVDANDKPPAAPSAYFPTLTNGLAVKRTTSQVLAIVYANSTAGSTSGGFFSTGREWQHQKRLNFSPFLRSPLSPARPEEIFC